MEFDKTVLAGVGGVLAGVLLSYAVGSSGRAALEAQVRQQGDLSASVAALDERLAAIDGKVDASFGALTERVEAMGAAPHDAGLQDLGARLEALGGDLTERLRTVGPEVRETLSEDFDDVRDRLAALAERGAAAVGAAAEATGAVVEETEAPVGDPAAATGEGAEIRVGQTATLGDGAVRVFLSRADAESGTATVAVNGFTRAAVALGGALPAGDCTVVMTGLAAGSAIFDATCGEAPAASEAAAPAAGAAEAAAPTGAGQSLRVGQTAIFADGSVRVFLSSVDAEAGSARVSVNAAAPAPVSVGAAETIGACTVTLTSVAPGSATFDGTCDGAAPAAAPAEEATAAPAEETATPVPTEEAAAAPAEEEAAPAAAAAAEPAAASPAGGVAGTEVSVGQTVILADGDLRVFLSAFDAEAGTARVAINGTAVTALTLAEPVLAGECQVVLSGGSGRTAIIDGGC